MVAPLTAANKLVLIKQERIPIRATIWEMPAGQIDEEVAEVAAAGRVALRELAEETGYELGTAGELISLGEFYSSPGFTDEQAYLFAARGVQRSREGHAPEEDEAIVDCEEFDLAQIEVMINEGTICDANTLSTWARLHARKIVETDGAA